MKYLKLYLVPAFVIVISLLFIRTFRIIPTTKLWTGYTVLYVTSSADSSYVSSLLEQNGCKDFICLENQKVPLLSSSNSPDMYLATSGIEKSEYLTQRNIYFFDKSKEYKIYYILDEYEKEISHALHQLQSEGYNSGVNSNSSYPWLSILIASIFAIILVLYSEKKFLTFLCCIMPIYFCFMVPFYLVCSAVCLFMYALNLSFRFFNREGAVNSIYKNFYIVSFFTISILLCLFVDIRSAFMFVLTVMSDIAICHFYKLFFIYIDSKYSFKFVPIRPASLIPVFTKNNTFCMLVCGVSCALILVSAVINVNVSGFDGKTTSPVLPGKNGASKSFPKLDDFVNWSWEVQTFPYRAVSGNDADYIPQKGETLYFPRYIEKDGIIVQSYNSISFDDNFKKGTVANIENLPYAALEKLLVKQGSSLPGYVSSGARNVSIFTLILLFIALSLPFALYFKEVAR